MTLPIRHLHIKPATGFCARLFGLLGHARLKENDGRWLAPCRAIHTVGMRFCIDLIFLASDGTVLRIDRSVPPFQFRLCWRAQSVIEVNAGWADQINLHPGERLEPLQGDGPVDLIGSFR